MRTSAQGLGCAGMTYAYYPSAPAEECMSVIQRYTIGLSASAREENLGCQTAQQTVHASPNSAAALSDVISSEL